MTKFYGNIFAILTTINKKSHPEGWLALLHCTLHYSTLQNCTRLHRTILHFTVPHNTLLYHISQVELNNSF